MVELIKEITTNMIFFTGCFFLFIVLITGIVMLVYAITQPILEYKQFYIKIFNYLVTKKFKEISDEKFEEWINKMRKKYNKINKNKLKKKNNDNSTISKK